MGKLSLKMKKILTILLTIITLTLSAQQRYQGYTAPYFKGDTFLIPSICPKPSALSQPGFVSCNDTIWGWTGLSWIYLGKGQSIDTSQFLKTIRLSTSIPNSDYNISSSKDFTNSKKCDKICKTINQKGKV